MNFIKAASDPAAVTSLFLQSGMSIAPDESAGNSGRVVYTVDGVPCMNRCCVDECEDEDAL